MLISLSFPGVTVHLALMVVGVRLTLMTVPITSVQMVPPALMD